MGVYVVEWIHNKNFDFKQFFYVLLVKSIVTKALKFLSLVYALLRVS